MNQQKIAETEENKYTMEIGKRWTLLFDVDCERYLYPETGIVDRRDQLLRFPVDLFAVGEMKNKVSNQRIAEWRIN